jgi:putative transposase
MLVRFDKESEYHFTTFSTYNKEKILILKGVPKVIFSNLQILRDDHKVLIFGFVIMPNHIHLIWHIPQEPGISKIMQLFKGRTSKEILSRLRELPVFNMNILTTPQGRNALWKRKFYDFNLISKPKFIEKLDYIHNNPVRWGLVPEPKDWPYSSFRSWYDLPGVTFAVDKMT